MHPRHLPPSDRRAALRRLGDPAATRHNVALIQDAWGALKAERGQPVRWDRLDPRHLLDVRPAAPAAAPLSTEAERCEAARLRTIPLIRARVLELRGRIG